MDLSLASANRTTALIKEDASHGRLPGFALKIGNGSKPLEKKRAGVGAAGFVRANGMNIASGSEART